MKKLLLLPILALLFVSCEGPMGPPGRDGQDGQVIVGQMFEVTATFNSSNDYQEFFDIPSQIEVFDSDIIMVYILDGVDNNGRDIWQPLPKSFFFDDDDDVLIYSFDYTMVDVSLFLDGTVYFDDLPSEFTQDIIFRVAVLPVDGIQGLNLNNMENVLNAMGNKEIIILH